MAIMRFEPTYEELKPVLNVLKRIEKRRFWAYLWGIETIAIQLVTFFKYKVLSLPMRNWNTLKSSHASSLGTSFWAYLWGIETKYLLSKNDKQLCFEPTYEELKLIQKHAVILCLQRFEPTYEELKLKERGVVKMGKKRFWAYLWGIETRWVLFWKWRMYWVLSLPMRNWNPKTHFTIKGSKSGFEPTYEELKLQMVNSETVARLCFEPTYEELKRSININCKSFCVGFEPTYEELKQCLDSICEWIKEPFWAYLWGIETLVFLA